MVDNFILDWKLPGSGEDYKDTWQVFQSNFENLNTLDAVKFTIKDRADYDVAKHRYENDIQGIQDEPLVYAGVVWGAMDTEELCRWMLDDDLDWRLNVQVHKFVWAPDKIGV
jgi:7-carboxy-7-deazaguanine synthase